MVSSESRDGVDGRVCCVVSRVGEGRGEVVGKVLIGRRKVGGK